MTTQVTYSHIKAHRNSKRLWFEGKRLAAAGFEPGATYTAEITDDKVVLTVNPDGDRKVPSRKRRGSDRADPIIDICSQKLFEAGTRIRAVFQQGVITVTIHHEDQKQAEREERLLSKVANGEPISEGTMCAGIGVSTLAYTAALKSAGIESVVEWVVDQDGRYLQVAIDNNPAVTDETRIFEATLEELEDEFITPVDVLSVSLPCTGHSKAGKVKNGITAGEEHSTAATSVFGFMRGLWRSNPAVVFSENVVEARDSMTYQLIRAELSRLGYVVKEYILDGDDAGTLEQRVRYFFTAVSKGIAHLFDLDTIVKRPRIHATVGDVLEPISDDDPMWSDNQYLKDKQVRDAAAGKGFANRQLLTPAAAKVGTIGRHYNKRRSTEPFLTRADGKERLFTPVEACRMKRIPEWLVGGVATTVAHEGQGQSGLFTHFTQHAEPIAKGLATLLPAKKAAA